MARCGDVYENKITGERGAVLRGDEDSDRQPALVHLIVQPRGTVAGEHIHPRIREAFRVISGRLGTRVGGVERTLTAGEEAVAVPGTLRDLRNRGEEEAHVLPGLSPLDPWSGQMIGMMYGLANAGKATAKGIPNLLQPAMTGREFQDVAQYAKPPRAVQRVMFGLLGPPGRVCGYRGFIPSAATRHGRTTPDPAVLALAGLALQDPDDLTGHSRNCSFTARSRPGKLGSR
jgi:mannose-6-phosphate isomerase-like protein (cupin superfamily)